MDRTQRKPVLPPRREYYGTFPRVVARPQEAAPRLTSREKRAAKRKAHVEAHVEAFCEALPWLLVFGSFACTMVLAVLVLAK